MQASLLLLTAALALTGPHALGAVKPAPAEARITHCLISLIEDVQVPAQESGVLVSLEAREGMQVEVGTMLARINDNKPQLQKEIALAEHHVSQVKANDDVNIRYAKAATKTAEAELRLNERANDKVPGTKSSVDIQKLALQLEQARLQIEKYEHEQQIAKFETEGYAAKVDAAEDDILRRQIKAPINGEVVEVLFRPGEWVEPGNPVLRIVRMDRLRIEGFLNASEFSPSEIINRPIRVEVKLARGRMEAFQGKVVFVDPLVRAGGEYRIWAEVVNRKDNGPNDQWMLRPGLEAEMTIDVGGLVQRPGAAAGSAAAATPRR
jgi:multidrug efflux pump subunit AcrA (membrane-fusion protein)